MRRIHVTVFMLFLILTPLLHSDEQGWINNGAGFTLSPSLSLKLSNEVRNRELTFINPFLKNWQGGFSLKLPANFSAVLLYKRENTEKTDFLLAENRFTLEAGWKTKISPAWDLDLRFRTEIRRFEKDLAENHLRFRLRVRLKTKIKIGGLELAPFIATEPFGDTLVDGINRNRFYLGTYVVLSQNVELVANYIRQDTKDKDVIHVFNTGIQLKF